MRLGTSKHNRSNWLKIGRKMMRGLSETAIFNKTILTFEETNGGQEIVKARREDARPIFCTSFSQVNLRWSEIGSNKSTKKSGSNIHLCELTQRSDNRRGGKEEIRWPDD